jgi:tetratricopeptide (TPR) repeat protein
VWRRLLQVTGMSMRTWIAIGAGCVAAGALFAQAEAPAANPQSQLARQIDELRAANGPMSASLVEPLRALALAYEEGGDHALAIVAVEEARYLTRVHQGLSSADEALLIRQQIRSEHALGLHERVWDLEQEMVTIARQNHDDIRMAPVFRELAEDRADALREYRNGGFPKVIELGCYYIPGRRRYDDTRGAVYPAPTSEPTGVSCRSGQNDTVFRNLRADVLLYYADAIEVLLESGDYASQELRDLEKAAFRISTYPGFFPVWASVGTPVASSGGPIPMLRCSEQPLDELIASEILGSSCLAPLVRTDEAVAANVGGGASLVRLIAYEFRSGASVAARGNAIAELADWYLLSTSGHRRQRFASSERALRLYEHAYRELQQDNAARASIFSPAIPLAFVQPPRREAGMPIEPYAPAPDLFASTATTKSPRYIDVSFEITKYGLGERIEILDTSRGATRAEERELIRLIESLSFRPRFVDGKLADSAPVAMRYSLE